MKTIRIIVDGRVQGVGFRYMTKLLAEKMHVNGWVRNQFDGSVEIIAQADEEVLNQFIEKVKASPSPSGRVNHLKIDELSENTIHGFRVKY